MDGGTRGTLIGVLSLLIAPGLFGPMLTYLQFGSWPLCFMGGGRADGDSAKLLHMRFR